MKQHMHLALISVFSLVTIACSSSLVKPKGPTVGNSVATAPARQARVEPEKLPAPKTVTREAFERITTPLYEQRSQSLVLSRASWVLSTPLAGGQRLGLIGGGTRVREKSHVVNDDCSSPWIEVEPQGWVCVLVKPSLRPPTSAMPAKAMRNMPGTYAIATKTARFYKSRGDAEAGTRSRRAKGDMVKRRETVHLDNGQVLWRTDRDEYVDPSTLRRLSGSRFQGVDLTDEHSPMLPFAFAVHGQSQNKSILVRAAPSRSARVVKRLAKRSVVEVLSYSDDGDFVNVAPGRWIDREDLRIVEARTRPSHVAAGTRWIDVDLDQQLVVAYEGATAVFATLASTGKGINATPTGVFNITRKKRQTTMRSDRSKKQSYSVAVPWPVYFNKGFAFHSTYWHNNFGSPRSHGCVNLSPSDAARLYRFVGPEMPAGWTVVYGHETQPGTAVHVRSKEDDATFESAPRLASQ